MLSSEIPNYGILSNSSKSQKDAVTACYGTSSGNSSGGEQRQLPPPLLPSNINGRAAGESRNIATQQQINFPPSDVRKGSSSSPSSSSTCSGSSSLSTTRPATDYLRPSAKSSSLVRLQPQHQLHQQHLQQPHYATIGRHPCSSSHFNNFSFGS